MLSCAGSWGDARTGWHRRCAFFPFLAPGESSPRPWQGRPGKPGCVVELVVQVDRGADEREVAERLREVAELLARAADLLGVQAEMVGVGVHLLEGELGLFESASAGERVDVPERAQRECALAAAQAVRRH